MFASRRSRRAGVATVVAVAAFAASATTANAGLLVASAPSCADQALQKTFLPWLDVADYTALAGGDFETGAEGWSMDDGAAVTAGNESFYVGDDDDANSLALASGAPATSPTMCVGIAHPTIRFFAKRSSTALLSSLSTLRVDVLFETSTGSVASLPVGSVLGNGNWQATAPMLVVANLLPLLPGDMTPVRFRFTAEGGAWSVDDVWVDPYSRR